MLKTLKDLPAQEFLACATRSEKEDGRINPIWRTDGSVSTLTPAFAAAFATHASRMPAE